MENHIYNPQAELLLEADSDEAVTMTYIDQTWAMPKIGPRPPYYCNPVYKEDYPTI
ncbi:hypothetical protein [Alkalihalophilus marmarensis]|uniref:hypothetical protein n=1 Tax=Alkalihalophilus marmarensis TaxID=521377 RepID=UPI002DB89124|nr:hypothetical protein [Alkalihalophilus marmarensis]MEC2071776.1 hypothetical protein [Alkalihalophilus marmarensis]